MKERCKLSAFADELHTGPLGSVHLVAGEGQQVDVFEFAGEIERQLAGGLHGVGVEAGAVCLCDPGQFADGLRDAGFVVREHYRDEPCVRLEGGFEKLGSDQAVAVGLEIGDFHAPSLQGFGCVEDRMVLNGRGDEVCRFPAFRRKFQIGLQGTGKRQVVAFRTAGGEDDFGGCAAKQSGDGAAGALHGRAGALAAGVAGAGVAELLGPERLHGGDDLGQHGGGRVGVEINPIHGRAPHHR